MAKSVGIVGCGRISHTHFMAIKDTPGLKLTGCCDIIPERAQSAAEKFSIPYWTTDFLDLLQKSELDLVSICTPSGIHSEQGILAALHAKNVLVEKPIATKVKDAQKLIQVSTENNTGLFVVFQNRYNPTIQLLKKAIDNNRFGRLYMIVANVFWNRPQEYYNLAPWRGTWAMDGGAFCNQASHIIDLVQWLAGPAQSVFAHTDTLARHIEVEDTGSAILKLNSGCIAAINVTMLTYPKNLEGSITIMGETGTARIGGIALNKILNWQFSTVSKEDSSIQSISDNPDSVYGYGHHTLYRNIAEFLAGKPSQIIDGKEGIKSLEIIEAAYKSSRTRRAVNVHN